jgi:hypothetical protein
MSLFIILEIKMYSTCQLIVYIILDIIYYAMSSSGSGNAPGLVLNIEQYEYMVGRHSQVGIQVTVRRVAGNIHKKLEKTSQNN